MPIKTENFDYHLPGENIAQTPLEPRDKSRLLVFHKHTGAIEHLEFRMIGNFIREGDILVINQTRVLHARLFARKIPSGGKIELLLLKKLDKHHWEVIIGGNGMRANKRFMFDNGITGVVKEEKKGSERIVAFDTPIDSHLESMGHIPLPPYIHTALDNPERYQTVFAKELGSAAAPTAGLHFTSELLDRLRLSGVKIATVTLHVGLDTFLPVTEEFPIDHRIHQEWCHVPEETVNLINEARQVGNRVFAVGTTSIRTLESAASKSGRVKVMNTYSGNTSLYILPGYRFKVIDAVITNFHLPKSTLIMLISSLTGREKLLAVYNLAIRNHYRFYSFGDAMMII